MAGGTPIDPARSISIETSTGAESRASENVSHQQRQQRDAGATETDLTVAVHANGSAIWTVQYHLQLDGTNETAAFDRLRADIESRPARYRERFGQRMTEAVESGENSTAREMAVENVRVRAVRNGTTGVVTYEFVWKNFVETDDSRLQIGDALTDFSLDNGTQLTISWPDAYETATVRPDPTDRGSNAVTWAESTEFNGTEPFVELVHSDSTTGTNNGAEGSSGVSAFGIELPLPIIGQVALVLLIGGLGVVWLVRRRETADTSTAVVDSDPDGDREIIPETVETPFPSDEQLPGTTNTNSPSLDLLSNEERVVEALKRLGGRAKQQQIIEELGWTDAKTSTVVSDLREDGVIEGFRLGRENVLSLPDVQHENNSDDSHESDTENPMDDE